MSKVALVVGGGRNLGAFLCNGLAAAGYKVAVADLDGQSAQETATAIAEQFGADNVMAVQANSTDEADVERMVGAIEDRCVSVTIFAQQCLGDHFLPDIGRVPNHIVECGR